MLVTGTSFELPQSTFMAAVAGQRHLSRSGYQKVWFFSQCSHVILKLINTVDNFKACCINYSYVNFV